MTVLSSHPSCLSPAVTSSRTSCHPSRKPRCTVQPEQPGTAIGTNFASSIVFQKFLEPRNTTWQFDEDLRATTCNVSHFLPKVTTLGAGSGTVVHASPHVQFPSVDGLHPIALFSHVSSTARASEYGAGAADVVDAASAIAETESAATSFIIFRELQGTGSLLLNMGCPRL